MKKFYFSHVVILILSFFYDIKLKLSIFILLVIMELKECEFIAYYYLFNIEFLSPDI